MAPAARLMVQGTLHPGGLLPLHVWNRRDRELSMDNIPGNRFVQASVLEVTKHVPVEDGEEGVSPSTSCT